MRGGQASITAQRVAAHRLTFERAPFDGGDAAADDRLARDVAGDVAVHEGPMRNYLAARTRFFDRVVVAAVERGMPQIVVGAAGYDGRALRYRDGCVRWFEVDHPDTQDDKRARLDALGIDAAHITFVAADFTVDSVASRLRHAGFDDTRAALFTLEGVAVYLERTVLDALVSQLRSVAATRSLLAISLSVDTGSTETDARRKAFQARVAGVGEPARSTLAGDDVDPFLAATGWRAVEGNDRARRAGLVVAEPAA